MAKQRRRHVPLAVQLEVALRQLGLDPEHVRLDHHPALGLRERTPDGGYDPDELDPRFMQFMSTEDHHRKTHGTPAGQKVVHVADGDQHKVAKAARIRRNLSKPKPERTKWGKGRKIESRGFAKRPKAKNGGQPNGT